MNRRKMTYKLTIALTTALIWLITAYGEICQAAEPIARFDVVPYQTFRSSFAAGIVAFHRDGINRVEFSYDTLSGPKNIAVNEMTLNPHTGVVEYWTALDAAEFIDGPVTINAKVYANSGDTRELAVELNAAGSGALSGVWAVFVSQSGSDLTGGGSEDRPFRTIKKAIEFIGNYFDQGYDGADIILADAGYYEIDEPDLTVENSRWITIQPRSGLSRDSVIIVQLKDGVIRPRVRRLHFNNLSFDFAAVDYIYKEDGHSQWFEGCRFFWSEPLYKNAGFNYTDDLVCRTPPVRNFDYSGLYITDSVAENSLMGFVNADLVRNSRLENISGAAFKNCLFVANCIVEGVDGTEIGNHASVFSWQSSLDNIIVYGVKAADIKKSSNFVFMEQDPCINADTLYPNTFTDCAFVNIAVQNFQDTIAPPVSEFSGNFDHVLFMHVSNPGQRSVFIFAPDRPEVFRDFKFVNCVLEKLDFIGYEIVGGTTVETPMSSIEGLSMESCHFIQGELLGDNPSTGAISITDGAASTFSYMGDGVDDITGTGSIIPGFSHPNDGQREYGAPSRGAFPFEVEEPWAGLLGDVTGNGKITSYDASLAARYAVGLITLEPDAVLRADVTGNNRVSSYDASLIAQYAVGLISSF